MSRGSDRDRRRRRVSGVLLGAFFVLFAPASADRRPPAIPTEEVKAAPAPVILDPAVLQPIFAGTTSAFVLYDRDRDRFVRYDEDRCRERFTPLSTFKIPNSLIALETGVVRDPDAVVAWERAKHPPEEWWTPAMRRTWGRDQTLRSALKNSVVWFYQDLATQVGPDRMAEYLEKFDYGNRDISGGIDRFWLGGTLSISADDQVRFLRSFYEGRLPVSPRSIAVVKDILVLEEKGPYRLSGKTGGGDREPGRALGWLVGYVETGGDVYFFACNTEAESYEKVAERRMTLTRRALAALGVLPE